MLYRVIKMTLGVLVGIYIAILLNLSFPLSAGIIVMLSLLDTKKQTFSVAWKRIYTAGIGFVLSAVIFNWFGFEPWVLGLFLLAFVPISLKLNAAEGVVMNTVIATHFMSFQSITLVNIINELALLGIGIGVAIVLNLHMPSLENELKEKQSEVEKHMKHILMQMSFNLKNLCLVEDTSEEMAQLEPFIKDSKVLALKHVNNLLLVDHQIYVDYFQMRLDQFYWMLYMQKHFKNCFITQTEAEMLSEFTEHMAEMLSVENDPKPLLDELARIRALIVKQPIPTTQLEFENYSALYQYMNDLETFILLKLEFSKKYL
ncbi:aromatic acid exporter family protein [Fusibacter ferrireducens]|uniref:Aromatic acid exporter family protein n=1 Tax=Fusibacter ferrireducens TaxID=2785058 RepID=A0ABR9ZS74_9FIRM|nr:aromatic acid exporter family protein [Fusibacter ferrireducens]MBF4693311.1 aromatic acid exporter family protein [Fusibacter ferrireducens]